jgi:hypothetical protein
LRGESLQRGRERFEALLAGLGRRSDLALELLLKQSLVGGGKLPFRQQQSTGGDACDDRKHRQDQAGAETGGNDHGREHAPECNPASSQKARAIRAWQPPPPAPA